MKALKNTSAAENSKTEETLKAKGNVGRPRETRGDHRRTREPQEATGGNRARGNGRQPEATEGNRSKFLRTVFSFRR